MECTQGAFKSAESALPSHTFDMLKSVPAYAPVSVLQLSLHESGVDKD